MGAGEEFSNAIFAALAVIECEFVDVHADELVRQGAVQAASFAPVQALLDCGSTTSVDATPPPGAAGTTVPVTVTTLESYFTGSGPSPTTASFTYK